MDCGVALGSSATGTSTTWSTGRSSQSPEEGGAGQVAALAQDICCPSLKKEYGVVRGSFRSGLTVELLVILQSNMYKGEVD